MTDQTQQLEDILTALATLTEHNDALLEQRAEQSRASSKANMEQLEQQTQLVKQLSAILEDIRQKDTYMTDETLKVMATNIDRMFKKIQKDYHEAINKGFATHLKQSEEELLGVSTTIQKQLTELGTFATETTALFDKTEDNILSYKDSYATESAKLKSDVQKTLNEVTSTTKSQLEALSAEYVNSLSWKTTAVFGAVCFSVVLLAFFVAWLFIPSKTEIAQLRADYATLERYGIADNVAQGDDGFYANVIESSCFKAKDGKFYCKFR